MDDRRRVRRRLLVHPLTLDIELKAPEGGSQINVLLLLREHLPATYRELHRELKRLREREEAIREELAKIEQHAVIEKIDLTKAAHSEPLSEATP